MIDNILDGQWISLLTHVSILDQSLFDLNMSLQFDTDIYELNLTYGFTMICSKTMVHAPLLLGFMMNSIKKLKQVSSLSMVKYSNLKFLP